MSKGLMYFSIIICSTIGSFVPVLWHASLMSMTSILAGFVGAIVGVWVGVKLNAYFG